MSRRLAVALVFLLPALAAFAGSPTPQKPLEFGTGVTLVSVPVFAVDRSGRAQRGLQAADFELFDDGRRVPIVSFQYVDTTSEEAQDEIRQAPAARRRFLLLFDLSFTDPGGLNRAQKAAREFLLRRLAPSDLAAVATFDADRGIRIVANFSEDRALVAHAVATLGVAALARIDDPLALALQLDAAESEAPLANRADVEVSTGRGGEAAGAAQARALAGRMRAVDEQIYRGQVLRLVDSLGELARSLRGVEGRKQVLFFSAGFDSRPLVGASGSEAADAGEALAGGRQFEVETSARYGDVTLRAMLTGAMQRLSGSDCVVHTIDVTGLAGQDRITQLVTTRDAARPVAGRESLNFIAAQTGGRFFRDTNDLSPALGELLEMTSRFYVLGYQPDDLKGPGHYHKLKVKLARKGSKLSHRAGFHERLPRSAQSPLQRMFEAAQLVVTGAGTNDLRFSALCYPFPAGDRQILGLVVQVPHDELHWDRGRVALELYGYVVAVDGSVVDHMAHAVRLQPDETDPLRPARGVSLYGTLGVPPGRYTLKLMLVETDSGASGVQFIELDVPAPDRRLGYLLPPLVADEMGDWVAVELGSGQTASPFPFAIAGRPFMPRASFNVRSGATERLVLILYRPDRPSEPAATVEIRSTVIDAAGHLVPAGALRIERVSREAEGRRVYLLEYLPEGLDPGEYTLRVGLGEAGSELESYALFRVDAGVAHP